MRITICAFDRPGLIDGPTTWLRRLMPYLKANGIIVRIIFIAANSKKLAFYNECKENGYGCKLVTWDLFWEEKVTAILTDLRDHPPDVFVPNYFPAACYAGQIAKKAGIPSLIVLHNDNPFHHALVDEFIAGNDKDRLAAVVAVSDFIKQKVDEKDTGDAIIEYITYGAPVPLNKANLSSNGVLKLVYAGRLLEQQKKISELTSAMCKVVKEIPGTTGVIYGSGDALPSVLNILSTEGADLPINFGGALHTNEVQEHLLQNHVYVLLSDYEGLPISLMEGMACGLVPVCLDIRSGVGELINHRENGFLVKDKKDSFIEAVKELKENPGLWQQCSNAARKKIEEGFSLEVCNRKWFLLIERLASMNSFSGKIEIPATQELKRIKVRKEFKDFDNRMGDYRSILLYRLKKRMGRLKRSLFG